MAINILKNYGRLSYIIPDTILNLGFTEAIRSYILAKTILLEVDLMPANVFAEATVDTVLIFFSKQKTELTYHESEVLIKIFNKKDAIGDLNKPQRVFTIPTKLWQEQKTFNIQSNDKEYAVIKRIDNDFEFISEFAEMFSGIKVYEVNKGTPPQTSQIRDSKPFTSEIRKNENWLPFFDGKDITRYELNWNQNNWINYGKWLAAPRLPQNFEHEKILIRKIVGKSLIAQYINYTSYCNTLLFVLKLDPQKAKISYKALLGIINSSFIGWYFRKKFQISNEDTFPQIMIRDILQFSIPNYSNSITNQIEMIVDSTLSAKLKGEETTALEQQIDALIYHLYDLTPDEIAIVENSTLAKHNESKIETNEVLY